MACEQWYENSNIKWEWDLNVEKEYNNSQMHKKHKCT